MESNCPEAKYLLPGCQLASIVHAVSLCRFPVLAHEQSWDGTNYNIQDSCGSFGTISFAQAGIVGVFFDCNSKRNPHVLGEYVDPNAYFRGMPEILRSIAESEALQYTLEEYNGQVNPMITAAFWCRYPDTVLQSSESWEDSLSNGVHLVERQLQPADVAMKHWIDDSELSESEATLCWELFQRLTAQGVDRIKLDDSEQEFLRRNSVSNEGLDACCQLLSAIGFAT